MAARNDITGDSLSSKRTTKSYRDGWDLAFGKKEDPVEKAMSIDPDVLDRAEEVFGSREKGAEWMMTGIPVLEGLSPSDILKEKGDEGKDVLMIILDKIETGDFS